MTEDEAAESRTGKQLKNDISTQLDNEARSSSDDIVPAYSTQRLPDTFPQRLRQYILATAVPLAAPSAGRPNVGKLC